MRAVQVYSAGDGQAMPIFPFHSAVRKTTVYTTSGTATTAYKLNDNTRVIRVSCSDDINFDIGGSSVAPTPAGAFPYLSKGNDIFIVIPFSGLYISFVQTTTGAKAWLDEFLVQDVQGAVGV